MFAKGGSVVIVVVVASCDMVWASVLERSHVPASMEEESKEHDKLNVRNRTPRDKFSAGLARR